MQIIKGDLFNSGERVIAHGCNCVGVMGAGVAKIVKANHPIVFEKYQRAIDAKVFNLGYAQFVVDQENDMCVYNLATQRQPGADGSTWGIYLAFCNMFEHAASNNITRIAIPKLGSGIARLDWEKQVVPQILAAKRDTRTTVEVVVYEL